MRTLALAPTPATSLAVSRIAVGTVWLLIADLRNAPVLAAVAPSLRAVPRGLGAIAAYVPVTPALATVAAVVVLIAAAFGTIGLFSRASFAVVALGGTYALGAGQLTGTVLHSHHLVWLAALLAVSPAGDLLSVDAWLEARRRGVALSPPPASLVYTLSLAAMTAVLAIVFFFPGFWKLRTSGLAWVTSDSFRNLVGWKAFQSREEPLLRIDQHPWLCHAAAAGAVMFELSFPLLVLAGRRGRLVAFVLALSFHAGTSALLHVHFLPLAGCELLLIDWDFVARRLSRRSRRLAAWLERVGVLGAAADAAPARRVPRAFPPVAAIVLGGALIAGALGITDAWPFACYPTFAELTPASMPALVVELGRADGQWDALPMPRTSRGWALGWRLAGVYGDHPTPARFDAYWATLLRNPGLRRELPGVTRVRFSVAWVDVSTRRTTSRRLLYERSP